MKLLSLGMVSGNKHFFLLERIRAIKIATATNNGHNPSNVCDNQRVHLDFMNHNKFKLLLLGICTINCSQRQEVSQYMYQR